MYVDIQDRNTCSQWHQVMSVIVITSVLFGIVCITIMTV